MAVPRFTTPADENMTADQRQVAKALLDSPRKGIRGPFPALLRRPKMADATRLLGDCIRYDSSLSDQTRELAILMVVRHWSLHIEWASHSKIARAAGMAEETLAALAAGQRPAALSQEQGAVYNLCAQLLRRQEPDEAVYQAVLVALGNLGIVDVIGTIAYYNYICTVMNAMAIPLPESAERLPPLA